MKKRNITININDLDISVFENFKKVTVVLDGKSKFVYQPDEWIEATDADGTLYELNMKDLIKSLARKYGEDADCVRWFDHHYYELVSKKFIFPENVNAPIKF